MSRPRAGPASRRCIEYAMPLMGWWWAALCPADIRRLWGPLSTRRNSGMQNCTFPSLRTRWCLLPAGSLRTPHPKAHTTQAHQPRKTVPTMRRQTHPCEVAPKRQVAAVPMRSMQTLLGIERHIEHLSMCHWIPHAPCCIRPVQLASYTLQPIPLVGVDIGESSLRLTRKV